MRRVALALALPLLALAVPDAARGAAVAFQANPAHTGDAGDVGLRLPLRPAWQVRLPGRLSFPVAADGRVFVVRKRPRRFAGTEVVAVSIASGRVLWRRDLGTEADDAGLGYGDGRVVVARESYYDDGDPSGVLALDAADGRVLWEQGGLLFDGDPPVVDAGVVFVKGLPQSSVTALRLSDGAHLWTANTDSGDAGSVAVDGDTVYAEQSGCPDVHRLRRADGGEVWNTENGCHGGGGWTPSVYRGRVYTRAEDPSSTEIRLVYDAATGAVADRLRLDDVPAFSRGIGIFPYRGPRADEIGQRLTARDLASGRVRWRFRGDGYLDSAPLIASGIVFTGSGSGRLYGVALRSGRVVWRARARTQVPAPGAGDHGLAAAERTLFVPALGRLIAYR